MDNLKKYSGQTKRYSFALLAASYISVIGLLWLAEHHFGLNDAALLAVAAALVPIFAAILAVLIGNYVNQPLKMLGQAILHVMPEHSGIPAPNLDKLHAGRELITSLSMQVYQLASAPGHHINTTETGRPQMIIDSLPLPLIVTSKDQNIIYANEAAAKYLEVKTEELIGKNFYSILDLSFTSDNTLDAWLNDARANKVTASQSWDRVRRRLPDNKDFQQFDLSAYYNKNNPNGVETILTIFDHTRRYNEDDQDLSFVALAVHELRTPLTLLRGYIEVFEEELGDKLDEELKGYLKKMQAASQQLTAFVNNILNVARVEADQLTLQLNEENWGDIVKSVINDLSLRAQVQGKSIEYSIPADLPSVAVDRVSSYEVLSNLLDNAIKYSPAGQKIIIKSYLSKDGLVETTVQDFGVGIPDNVLPNLFEKFYRNFKTKQQVGGTGLGLYLSKAIISAHGGNIWVQSKEGQGTTFGFTLKPYQTLADELKNKDNKDIVRSAHGWIKNHSLYRR